MHRLPTILIVDDDEGHSILIRQSLAEVELENEFVEFRDGQAVLDFLFKAATRGERPPAKVPFLLLLDIRMPKVDGIEVLRRVKSDPRLRALPVIMLSTTDDPGEVDRCHKAGCSAYVQKPVDYDTFAEVVRRLGSFMKILTVPMIAAF
jgi:CheY-like chemotaxis protein